MVDHPTAGDGIDQQAGGSVPVPPDGDPGHLLPDEEWARVVADAQRHPGNPHNPGGEG